MTLCTHSILNLRLFWALIRVNPLLQTTARTLGKKKFSSGECQQTHQNENCMGGVSATRAKTSPFSQTERFNSQTKAHDRHAQFQNTPQKATNCRSNAVKSTTAPLLHLFYTNMSDIYSDLELEQFKIETYVYSHFTGVSHPPPFHFQLLVKFSSHILKVKQQT